MKRIVPVFLLCVPLLLLTIAWLRGCQNEHYRPHGHQDITVAVSPTGNRLVFPAMGTGGRDLYSLDLTTNRVARLTNSPEYETAPAFSPDGASLVYVAGKPGERGDHIYMMSLRDRRPRKLTEGACNDCTPSYSADGSLIIYARDFNYRWGGLAGNWSGGGELWCMKPDGSGQKRLLPSSVFVMNPSLSADGRYAVWVDAGRLRKCLLSNPSSVRDVVNTDLHEAAVGSAGHPIIYSAGQYSPDVKLYASFGAGLRDKCLTPDQGGCYHPALTMDSRSVYYLSESWPDGTGGSPKFDLWRVNVNGGAPVHLANSDLFDYPMRWRP